MTKVQDFKMAVQLTQAEIDKWLERLHEISQPTPRESGPIYPVWEVECKECGDYHYVEQREDSGFRRLLSEDFYRNRDGWCHALPSQDPKFYVGKEQFWRDAGKGCPRCCLKACSCLCNLHKM